MCSQPSDVLARCFCCIARAPPNGPNGARQRRTSCVLPPRAPHLRRPLLMHWCNRNCDGTSVDVSLSSRFGSFVLRRRDEPEREQAEEEVGRGGA